MALEFSELIIPIPENTLEPVRYEKLKRTIMGLLLSQRLEVFDREGGATRWAPLSEAHAARRLAKVPKNKRKKKNAVKILQDDGTLRQSFTAAPGPGNSQRVEETTGDTVRLATNVEYAAIHNFGGVIEHPGTENGFGRGITIPAHPITIPARPFDEFSEQDQEQIADTVENFVNGHV